LHIFDILDTEDNKILELLETAKDHHEILDLFARRINLYKKCAEQTDDRMERGIIEAKKMVIMGEVGLMSAQYKIQTEIDKINSRLDSSSLNTPNQKTS
jgi:hypothetical protein